MRTVGEILKEARLKQGKTILEIHRETKIPEKTLLALEANEVKAIAKPETGNDAYTIKGFIQNYGKILGLDEKHLMAIFKRDWQKKENPKIIHDGIIKPLDRPNSFWTPSTLTILIISALTIVFASFITWQIKNYYSKPKLIIDQPQDNEQTTNETITVSGKTGSEVAVYVNDELTNVDESGSFTYQLELFPGDNKITIKAVNRRKRETMIIKKVKKE